MGTYVTDVETRVKCRSAETLTRLFSFFLSYSIIYLCIYLSPLNIYIVNYIIIITIFVCTKYYKISNYMYNKEISKFVKSE